MAFGLLLSGACTVVIILLCNKGIAFQFFKKQKYLVNEFHFFFPEFFFNA